MIGRQRCISRQEPWSLALDLDRVCVRCYVMSDDVAGVDAAWVPAA
ncbi:MAG: hypothetical protein WBQ50_06670 [Nocardioides sp.]